MANHHDDLYYDEEAKKLAQLIDDEVLALNKKVASSGGPQFKIGNIKWGDDLSAWRTYSTAWEGKDPGEVQISTGTTPPLLFRCEACGKERTNEDVSVHSFRYRKDGGVEFERNIKYCNDNVICFKKAKEMQFDEPEDGAFIDEHEVISDYDEIPVPNGFGSAPWGAGGGGTGGTVIGTIGTTGVGSPNVGTSHGGYPAGISHYGSTANPSGQQHGNITGLGGMTA